MAVFIVLWPYLSTTKLKSVIRHNLGHSIPLICTSGICRDWSRNREQRSSFVITILIPKKLPPFRFCNGFIYSPPDGDTTSQKIGTLITKWLWLWFEEKSDLPKKIHNQKKRFEAWKVPLGIWKSLMRISKTKGMQMLIIQWECKSCG